MWECFINSIHYLIYLVYYYLRLIILQCSIIMFSTDLCLIENLDIGTTLTISHLSIRCFWHQSFDGLLQARLRHDANALYLSTLGNVLKAYTYLLPTLLYLILLLLVGIYIIPTQACAIYGVGLMLIFLALKQPLNSLVIIIIIIFIF